MAVALCAAVGRVGAAPAVSRSFDGPEKVWELLDTGTATKILAHDCIPGGARDRNGIERVAVAAAAGQSVLLACATPPVAALDELQVRIWIKSNRPDIQLAARIVMPRSIDPQRKTAATTIIKGAAYTKPGHWQELVLNDVPKLLAAQVRVLRTTPGATIDRREAYVDAVVLIVPGEPSGVELGTDQMVVEGVELDSTRIAELGHPSTSVKIPANSGESRPPAITSARSATPIEPARPANSAPPFVRLQSSLLVVEGRALCPRAIEWNGESFLFLAEHGFNVIQLAAPPSPEQITEASRHALWFVCVPPRPAVIAREGLGAADDRVLAWYLTDEALATDPNYAVRWADAIRERDAVYSRPILFASEQGRGVAAKVADIQLASHPRASRLTRPELEAWLVGRPRFAKPGTPIWLCLPSQFGEAAHAQTDALTRVPAPPSAVDLDQLEMVLQTSFAFGARGVWFRSRSPLDAPDPNTRSRLASLESVNRRLQLIEPWLASGKVVSRATSTDGRYEGLVLYVDRARLLVPVEVPSTGEPASQPKKPAAKEIVFLVPGVSESSQAYHVTPVAMNALATQRVAGGTRLALPAPTAGLIVITEDSQIVRALRQRIARQAVSMLRLQRDFVVGRVQSLVDNDRRLAQLGIRPSLSATDAADLNARASQIDGLVSSGQLEQAQQMIDALRAAVLPWAAEQQLAAGRSTGLQSNAYGLTFHHLADFASLQKSCENLHSGENLLPGGDFENLADMTQRGWQHVVHATAGAATRAELSPLQPEQGSYCLELQAASVPDLSPLDIAEPRLWITSPAVPLDGHETVEISGWVRVDQPFKTPGEGLAIVDSLGGPELSLVVGQTSGWQLFRLVRAAPQPTTLRITFALTGIGSAKIDAVMVRTLQQPIARRLPTLVAPSAIDSTSSAELPGPLLQVPTTR